MSLVLNLSDPNPPVRVWVLKGKDPKKDPWLDLRPASRDVLKKIREETHTPVLKNVGGVVHESYDVDEDKYDFLLWEYCMPGWGNLSDENGNHIPYSPEKAAFLLENSPYFSNLVSTKMDEAIDLIAKRAKAREKN